MSISMDKNLLATMLGLLPLSPSYNNIIPYLVDIWISVYEYNAHSSEIVQVDCGGFQYLFDVINERVIAAWGVSRGKNPDPRPATRMKGFPLFNGLLYHRGHAIPHTLGGGADINLVPQLGSINVGPFRLLEIRAVNTIGSLYFSHWTYPSNSNQTPINVEQGFLSPKKAVEITIHKN